MDLKKFALIIAVIATASFTNVYSQTSKEAKSQKTEAKSDSIQKGPKIKLDKPLFDFGDIKLAKSAEFDITLKNDGNEPLILLRVQGCCGGKVTDYTKSPILPGKTGSIKLEVSLYTTGVIQKTITVMSNDPENPALRVRVKANVVS